MSALTGRAVMKNTLLRKLISRRGANAPGTGQVEARVPRGQDFQICSRIPHEYHPEKSQAGSSGSDLHYHQSLKLQGSTFIFKASRQRIGIVRGAKSLLNANRLAMWHAAILPDEKEIESKWIKGIDLKVSLCRTGSL